LKTLPDLFTTAKIS